MLFSFKMLAKIGHCFWKALLWLLYSLVPPGQLLHRFFGAKSLRATISLAHAINESSQCL
jgi:hypothetical protein